MPLEWGTDNGVISPRVRPYTPDVIDVLRLSKQPHMTSIAERSRARSDVKGAGDGEQDKDSDDEGAHVGREVVSADAAVHLPVMGLVGCRRVTSCPL